MRAELEKINGMKKEFTGVFERFGQKIDFVGKTVKTVLLKNVVCITNKKISCNHVWLNFTKEFKKLDLKKGDVLRFSARVKEYWKGYKGYREELYDEHPIEKDYKLSYPTKIRLIKKSGGINGKYF